MDHGKDKPGHGDRGSRLVLWPSSWGRGTNCLETVLVVTAGGGGYRAPSG